MPAARLAAKEASEPGPADVSLPEIAAEPAPAPPVRQARPEPVEVNAAPAQAEVQEVDLSDEWASLLKESRRSEATVEAPAPGHAKPSSGTTPRQEPATVEEFQISEEPRTVAPDDVPAMAAFAQNAAPPAGSGFASDQFLADLANEIDALGIGGLAPGFSGAMPNAQPAPVAKPEAASPQSGESGPLKEVFDEFRAELGEMGAEDEDLETHYNLGIAFREMGLLEEAISEFQKVAKANERGRAFRYTMQCCTLLGLAFMEKGQPGIAAIWYERALKTPGNDPESTLALRYDLGVAQESAGEPEAALKSFFQVYAMNIDYRGVAERIAALQKPIRRS